MLRINLLPSYVAQRRITRQVGIAAGVLFFLSVAIPFYLYLQADRDRQDMEAKATEAEAQQQITQGYVTDAANRRSQIAPLKAKVDFVNQVYAYNLSQPAFFARLAQYTDPKIIYTDATVAGTTLTIKAFCPSLADVGRYLQAIYNEPDFQTVAIDKLPGYPEATVTRYYLYGKLVGVGTSPANTTPGAAGTPAPAAQNTPAPATTGAAGATGKSAYGQPLVSSALATAKDVPQNILDVLKSRISPFATPEQQARLYQDALTQLTSKTTPKGFDITVTATLKQAMTPPVVPGASGAATPSGVPGRPPGGFPGGPPPGGPNGG